MKYPTLLGGAIFAVFAVYSVSAKIVSFLNLDPNFTLLDTSGKSICHSFGDGNVNCTAFPGQNVNFKSSWSVIDGNLKYFKISFEWDKDSPPDNYSTVCFEDSNKSKLKINGKCGTTVVGMGKYDLDLKSLKVPDTEGVHILIVYTEGEWSGGEMFSYLAAGAAFVHVKKQL